MRGLREFDRSEFKLQAAAKLGRRLAAIGATQAPRIGLTGFAVLAVTLSLLIFVGEAVRDAFDPRKTA